MNISGDSLNLNPQPLPCETKFKELHAEGELELNKSRLDEIKKQMKSMKDQIKRFTDILRKEIGDEIDVKELLRQGHSVGWQGRAQMIMNLRLKLTAMRSKFLDPPHKLYYRGPFDPKKEFSLKYLPEKQENLYKRMLSEKMETILEQDKPVDVLKKELDDLSLMYRAARFRTKSLISKVNTASKKLEKSKEKAAIDLRVVEAMMAHQSLYKMMIDPETFQLDPTLNRHVKIDPLNPPEALEWTKFKLKLQNTDKEKQLFRDVTFTLTEKLDKINKDLIEAEQINTENRLFLEAQKFQGGSEKGSAGKDKPKGKGKGKEKGNEPTEEDELKILTEENRRLREFLLNSVLSTEEDFGLFISAIDNSKEEFIDSVH